MDDDVRPLDAVSTVSSAMPFVATGAKSRGARSAPRVRRRGTFLVFALGEKG